MRKAIRPCFKNATFRSIYFTAINSRRLSNTVSSVVRSAQAVEVFRSSYLNNRDKNLSVSTADIDDLIVLKDIRPSLLVGILDLTGKATGALTKVLPNSSSEVLNRIVNDCSVQELNDGMRSIYNVSECEDIKATLKFHRDIVTFNERDNDDRTTAVETEDRMANMMAFGLNQIFRLTRNL